MCSVQVAEEGADQVMIAAMIKSWLWVLIMQEYKNKPSFAFLPTHNYGHHLLYCLLQCPSTTNHWCSFTHTLLKSFSITSLCGTVWCWRVSTYNPLHLGAVVQLVEYRTRNQEVAGSTHTRSTASNIEQVANLLRAQANSASYPQRDGK